MVILAAFATARLTRTDYFWLSPLDGAHFSKLTDLGGTEQAAAISATADSWRSNRIAMGRLTSGSRRSAPASSKLDARPIRRSPESIRPDAGLLARWCFVTFWARGGPGYKTRDISVWSVPISAASPGRTQGVAEFDWSGDGSQLAYHTPGPGDPTFVKNSDDQSQRPPIFAAAAGLHAHFPLWSPDKAFIYFVEGSVDDAMDVWRIRPAGGSAERITHHNSRVNHPVLLGNRTLLYLASERDGSGPWLYSLNVDHRVPHRLSGVFNRYTSLAGAADGRRLVATLSNPKETLWRLPIADTPVDASAATPVSLTTRRGFSPRLGRGYLAYVSSNGTSDGIWKLANGSATELWSAPEAKITGGPEVSSDGRQIAFSVQLRTKTLLYVMNADGTAASRRTFAGAARLPCVGAGRVNYVGGECGRGAASVPNPARRRGDSPRSGIFDRSG